MKTSLSQIAILISGIYAKPSIQADTIYIHAVHFDETGKFNPTVKPQLKLDHKTRNHLLQNDDILFAAKGRNNFAVVYSNKIGPAIASSSLIIIRINDEFKSKVIPTYLAWYLTHHPHVAQFSTLGTTVPSINMKQLFTLEVNIPAPERQKQILHLQNLHDQERQLINKIQTLKDEFIQRTLLKATK